MKIEPPEVDIKFEDLPARLQTAIRIRHINMGNEYLIRPWNHYKKCPLSQFLNIFHLERSLFENQPDKYDTMLKAHDKKDELCICKKIKETPTDTFPAFPEDLPLHQFKAELVNIPNIVKIIDNELFTEWELVPTVYPVITKIIKYLDEDEDEKEKFLVPTLEDRIFDQLVPNDQKEEDFEDEIHHFIDIGAPFHFSYYSGLSKQLVSGICLPYTKEKLPSLNDIVHECTNSAVKIFHGMRQNIEPGQDEPFSFYLAYLVEHVNRVIR